MTDQAPVEIPAEGTITSYLYAYDGSGVALLTDVEVIGETMTAELGWGMNRCDTLLVLVRFTDGIPRIDQYGELGTDDPYVRWVRPACLGQRVHVASFGWLD